MNYKILFSLPFLLMLTACNSNDGDYQIWLNSQVREVISRLSLTGNPFTNVATLPSINDPKAQLGKRLFFSKSLGGDRDAACVTCHHPALGGADALSLPVGSGAVNPDQLGPGRLHDSNAVGYDGGPTVPRNTPSTYNIAAWSVGLFLDSRVEAIPGGISTPDSGFGVVDPLAGSTLAQAQARFPVTSPEEMKGFNHGVYDNQGIREFLASRIGDYGTAAGKLLDSGYWLEQFQQVYNRPAGTAQELITEQNIFELIGTYERSQVFINTPWKAYIEGNNQAISDNAKQGALLFFGKAECAKCHSGDFFTDEKFHNIAAPQIGRGKGHGNGIEDFGRLDISGNMSDKYKFRTPTLLNVEVTGPWTHAGAYSTLEALIRHHLNPQNAIDSYDYGQLAQAGIQNLDQMVSNTQKAVNALEAERVTGSEVTLNNLELDDQQVFQLVEFLKTLTDSCVKSRDCLAPWIADAVSDADPNGDLLIAVGEDGVQL